MIFSFRDGDFQRDSKYKRLVLLFFYSFFFTLGNVNNVLFFFFFFRKPGQTDNAERPGIGSWERTNYGKFVRFFSLYLGIVIIVFLFLFRHLDERTKPNER